MALVSAARRIFARDGYHGARIDVIAREAGYSKGAVYSNFENKAWLFLAVMDRNMQAVQEGWGAPTPVGVLDMENVDEAMHGMALATLEFVAAAARDEELLQETRARISRLVDTYVDVARENGAVDGRFRLRELGLLLAALDQGSALLTIAGLEELSDATLQHGIEALIQVGAAGVEERDAKRATGDDEATSAFHTREVRERIMGEVMKQDGESNGG